VALILVSTAALIAIGTTEAWISNEQLAELPGSAVRPPTFVFAGVHRVRVLATGAKP